MERSCRIGCLGCGEIGLGEGESCTGEVGKDWERERS
jgi:hypothetical protein